MLEHVSSQSYRPAMKRNSTNARGRQKEKGMMVGSALLRPVRLEKIASAPALIGLGTQIVGVST